MNNSKSINEALTELRIQIQKAGQEVEEKSIQIISQVAESTKEVVSRTAPRSKGREVGGHHLADSFVVTESGIYTSKTFYISAKKNHKYSIVHLLELGHLRPYASTPRVEGKPFMKPARDEAVSKIITDISSLISNEFSKVGN